MDFTLSEEQRLIRATARQIAKERVAPRAAEIDEKGEYPEDIFNIYKEQGLLGLAIPPEYEGSGAGILGLCLAIEEVAKYCCASGLILLLTALSTRSILYAGTEDQRKKYLSETATGALRGAFGLTEPEAGSDVAGIKARAVKKGNEYILNGEKCFISGGTVADFFIIFAKTTPDGHRGISGFIVPRDAPGFSVPMHYKKMGVRGVPIAHLLMEDCRIPAANIIGRENGGFKVTMWTLNSVRPLVAARGVGLAEGALSYALEYSRNRKAFGQPIANFQGLQFMMADMVIEIEAARLLTYQAASLVDQGKYDKEAAPYLSVAKALASEMAVKVSSSALQLLGGHGYIQDHPLERFYRDARQLMLVEGTSQVHRMIISRGLLDGDIIY